MEEQIGIDITINAAESAKSVSDLKKSIRDLESAALKAGAAGNEALADKYVKAAGAAKSKIVQLKDDINDVTIGANKMQAITGVASTIAGGFAAATGAAALFGKSQEDVQKQLVKVQAAQAVLAGVQQMSELGEQARLIKIIALKQLEVAQTKLATIAENGGVIARNAAAAAQWLLNKAMSANPIGVVIVAVTALVAAYKLLGTSSEETAQKEIASNEKVIDSMKGRADQQVAIQKALGKSTEDLELQAEIVHRANIKREIEKINSLKEQTDDTKKLREDYLQKYQESADKEALIRAGLIKKNEQETLKANEELKKNADAAIESERKKNEKLEELRLKKNEKDEEIKKENEEKLAEEKEKKIDEDEKTFAEIEESWGLEKEREINKAAFLQGIREKETEDKRLALETDLINIDTAGLNSIDKQIEIAAFERDIVLNNIASTGTMKLNAQAQYNSKYNALKKNELRSDADVMLARTQMAQDTLNLAKQVGEGLIKDQGKLEKFNKKAALIQIGIDSAKAIASVVAAAASTSVTPVDLALKIAAGTATVLMNIAKARKLLQGDSGAAPSLGGSVAAGGGATRQVGEGTNVDTNLSRPGNGSQRELSSFGGGKNNFPSMPSAKDCNCPEMGTGSTMFDSNGNPIAPIVKAIVVESDITDSQGKIKAIKDRSTFG